jgi:hypothetical protein
MPAEHIPDSDPEDVLFERLNYLVDYHGPSSQHGECEECKRLMVIRNLLLRPFVKNAGAA